MDCLSALVRATCAGANASPEDDSKRLEGHGPHSGRLAVLAPAGVPKKAMATDSLRR